MTTQRGNTATYRSDDHLLAAAGTAIRYFGEVLADETSIPLTSLHRATTILTRQVLAEIEHRNPDDHDARVLHDIRALVTDPARVATASGTRASEFCGVAWPIVVDLASTRSSAAVADSQAYGVDAILGLARLHAANTTTPWWATPLWDHRTRTRLGGAGPNSLSNRAMRRAPEHLDDGTLGAILSA